MSLRVGSDSDPVGAVRELLGILRTDFDAALEEAVEDFQAQEGLLVDGIIGPATFQALQHAFSSVSAFDDEAELIYNSPAIVLHYDPLGRPVRTQHPDGTEERVERYTWSEVAFDASDTVLGSKWETDAAGSADPRVLRARTLSFVHDDTPTVSLLDALGRPFLVDEDNGSSRARSAHDDDGPRHPGPVAEHYGRKVERGGDADLRQPGSGARADDGGWRRTVGVAHGRWTALAQLGRAQPRTQGDVRRSAPTGE